MEYAFNKYDLMNAKDKLHKHKRFNKWEFRHYSDGKLTKIIDAGKAVFEATKAVEGTREAGNEVSEAAGEVLGGEGLLELDVKSEINEPINVKLFSMWVQYAVHMQDMNIGAVINGYDLDCEASKVMGHGRNLDDILISPYLPV
ncbi:hypothetical protein KXD40_005840 [Peronospora effusa]|nr:hypothetical protein KXD40_005840 [Peronospora effusa]